MKILDKTKRQTVCCSFIYFTNCEIFLNNLNCNSTKKKFNIYQLSLSETMEYNKFCPRRILKDCLDPKVDYSIYYIIAAFILLLFGPIFCYFFLVKYVGNIPTKMAFLQSDASLIKSDEIDKIDQIKYQKTNLPILKPMTYKFRINKVKKSRNKNLKSTASIDSTELNHSSNRSLQTSRTSKNLQLN